MHRLPITDIMSTFMEIILPIHKYTATAASADRADYFGLTRYPARCAKSLHGLVGVNTITIPAFPCDKVRCLKLGRVARCSRLFETMPDSKSGRKPRAYVSAFLCQSTIREHNNLLTAVRLVEGFTTTAIGELTTGEVMYFPVNVSAVVIFRAEGPTESNLTIKVRDPDGEELQGTRSFPVRSKSFIEGHTLNINFKVPGEKQGDFWFEVYVDDELMAKVPLRITHRRPVPRRESGQPLETTEESPDESSGLHQ
jgi:hypothetical protein